MTDTIDPEYAAAPTGMPWQRYPEEDDAHLRGLETHIADVLRRHTYPGDDCAQIAAELVKHLFKRVKVHQWCARQGCIGPCDGPTHYTFDLTTYPQTFAPPADDD